MGLTNFDALATKVASGITAKAGGGQAGATSLVSGSNGSGGQAGAFVVSTVATAADSVALPSAANARDSIVGMEVFVTNEGANSMQVFGSAPDTINGVATGTGVAQAAGVSAIYKLMGITAGVGDWRRLLSA